jgi:CubicO group peptidase (beta-lactamase class C family)
VTLRHLLAHTSGIGDYLDESTFTDIEDHVLDVPVHRLAAPQDFLAVLRGRPAKSAPGERFAYCNSGYVLLALLVEAVSGRSYYDIVHERVCVPAGMQATAFLRLDELPGSAAIGYLRGPGLRNNSLHLPVRGAGDGGVYSTADDLAQLWAALFAGRIVPPALLGEVLRPQHETTLGTRSYGLGFWLLEERGAVVLEGSDPGISFRSYVEPTTGLQFSVLSNTTSGAWALAKELALLIGQH